MAWTAPRTWVTGEIVTAAFMNTDVRDNMLQTAPALVTTKGDIVAATAANVLARLPVGADDTVLTADAAEAAGIKFKTPFLVTTLAARPAAGSVGRLWQASDTKKIRATDDGTRWRSFPNMLDENAGASLITLTTSDQDMYSFTIPAGLMADVNVLHFVQEFDYVQNSGAVRNWTITAKIAGVNRGLVFILQLPVSSAIRRGWVEFWVWNRDSITSNRYLLKVMLNLGEASPNYAVMGNDATGVAVFAGTEDFYSAAKVLAVTIKTNDDASVTQTLTPTGALLRIL